MQPVQVTYGGTRDTSVMAFPLFRVVSRRVHLLPSMLHWLPLWRKVIAEVRGPSVVWGSSVERIVLF